MGSARELLPPVMTLSLGVGPGDQGASLAGVCMPTQWKTHSSILAGGRSLQFNLSLSFHCFSLPPLFSLSFLYLKEKFPYSVATVAGFEWDGSAGLRSCESVFVC